MARVSLVICDLCKNNMEAEESQEEYTLALFSLNTDKLSADICKRCFDRLTGAIKSERKPTKSARKSGQSSTTEKSQATEKNQANSQKPTVQLLEGELQRIPSQFDKKKAEAAIRKMNNGNCRHPFHSLDDSGKYICADAPIGMKGDHANFKGCGELIPSRHLSISKPRHFAFND